MAGNGGPGPGQEAKVRFFEGNRRMAAGDADAAVICFREAIGLAPDFAEAHGNLGLLLDRAGQAADAERHYRLSLAANPDLGEIHLNLGVLLTGRKRLDDAEAELRRALQLMPDSAAAWSNLGVLQACRKQEADAELSYRAALALDGGHRLARFNLAYLLLRQGRFEEGWRCLEARDWYRALEQRLPCPRWQGEDLAGKSLLIGFEAGHGDMIQFCRYADVLKARGAARISLICHPPLASLFATLAGVDEVISFDQPLPGGEWDFWTPPLSIPFHCRTRLDSIPARLPYLAADPDKLRAWSAIMGDRQPGTLRVGLVWKGNPRFENDADRSVASLETLAPLGAVPGTRFFSVQKGAGEDEAGRPPSGLALVDLGSRIGDFSDTAAIVAQLDLLVSVDTAAAHLAGALGKPCWLLLPDYMTDWRWLDGREDSPWYPGVMRLFRQPRGGGWEAPVAALAAALRALAERPAA